MEHFFDSIYEAIEAMVEIGNLAKHTEGGILPFSSLPYRKPRYSSEEEWYQQYEKEQHLFYDDKDAKHRLIYDFINLPEHHNVLAYLETCTVYYKIEVHFISEICDLDEDEEDAVYLVLTSNTALDTSEHKLYIYNGKIATTEDELF